MLSIHVNSVKRLSPSAPSRLCCPVLGMRTTLPQTATNPTAFAVAASTERGARAGALDAGPAHFVGADGGSVRYVSLPTSGRSLQVTWMPPELGLVNVHFPISGLVAPLQ